ncbi:unnamed protein product [Rotaria sp. Silwood1]|nr:unnamed protein product [Rotaria sp. Silwood1]
MYRFFPNSLFVQTELVFLRNSNSITKFSRRLTKGNFTCQVYSSSQSNTLYGIHWWIEVQPSRKLSIMYCSLKSPITCIENLPNELFYEIFDYLDGYEIYTAFLNLNVRFQHIITSSLLPLKINLDSKSKTPIKNLCSNIIIPNNNRIRSLHVQNKILSDEFLTECIIDSSFNHLESIVLNEITNDKLQILLPNLKNLPHLFSLTIYLKIDYSYNFNDIYQMIYRLHILKYNKLSLLDNKQSNLIVSSTVNVQFSTIEYLVIDHNCSVNQLMSLLKSTPQLRRLQCKCLINLDRIMENKDKLILSHLLYISIAQCCLRFDKFETFITKISSQLEVLHITTYRDIAYLDADRWEQLIVQHISHLRRLNFNHYHQVLYNKCKYDDFSVLTNRFNSPFWIQRQWIFELKMTRTGFIGTVHSRRTWFDLSKHTEVTLNDNFLQTVQYSSNIQFTIADSCSATWYQSVINEINPIFFAIRFTRLHINCNEIYTRTFVKLVQLLPNLESLKLSSFPFLQLNYLSDEDTQNLRSISIKNKITKVSFKGMNDFEQVYFIIFLCTHMQYLEVRCTKHTNVDILLHFILLKSFTLTPHLRSLYFYVPNANEELIYKLQTPIYHEKLLNNYTIKRCGDNIHLQWK